MIVLSAAVFVVQRGQDANWDLLNYHYFQGYTFANGDPDLHIGPVGIQTFLNPTVFPITVFLHGLAFPWGGLLILAIQLSVLPAIGLLAAEMSEQLGFPRFSSVSKLAVVLSLISPIWLSQLGTSFFESWTASLVIWAVYLLLRAGKGLARKYYYLFAAGLLLSLAVGLKLTNAPFALAGFAMAIWISKWNIMEMIRATSSFTFGGLVGFSPTAWWNFYLLETWGNPVFPFFNSIFGSEFFDAGNWRDNRWLFETPYDLLSFLVGSLTGTQETSELLFADARYVIVGALAVSALLTRRMPKDSGLNGILVFFATSFLLWGGFFSYQRYFVPGELLLGLVVWLLIVVIFRELPRIVIVSSAIILFCVSLIGVPDWGHVPASGASGNPFQVTIPRAIVDQPALYLPVGNPVSYIFPFLNEKSEFHTLGISAGIDELISIRLETNTLPVRTISSLDKLEEAAELLTTRGFSMKDLSCTQITTVIGNYAICGVDVASVMD